MLPPDENGFYLTENDKFPGGFIGQEGFLVSPCTSAYSRETMTVKAPWEPMNPPGNSQQIHRRTQPLRRAMEVVGRRRQVRVPEELPDRLDVHALFQEPDGGRVPERVRFELFREPAQPPQAFHAVSDGDRAKTFIVSRGQKRPARSRPNPIFQQGQNPRRDRYIAILVPLPLAHEQRRSRKIDVFDVEGAYFRHAQPAEQAQVHDNLVAQGGVAFARAQVGYDLRAAEFEKKRLLLSPEEVGQLAAPLLRLLKCCCCWFHGFPDYVPAGKPIALPRNQPWGSFPT